MIQGQELQALRKENAALRAENAELEARVAELQSLLERRRGNFNRGSGNKSGGWYHKRKRWSGRKPGVGTTTTTKPPVNKPPVRRLRRNIIVLAIVAFVILVAFNNIPSFARFLQSFTPLSIGAVDTSAAKHASIKAGTLLYRADWSQGSDHWSGSSQWDTPGNGQMGSSGTDTRSFTTWSAVQLPTTNYAATARIRFLRSTYPSAYNRHYEFGIVVRGDGNGNGYEAGMVDALDHNMQQHGALVAIINNDNSSNGNAGFTRANNVLRNSGYGLAPNAWHTYKVEVHGNDIKFYLDGALMAQTSDNTYLSGVRVGLRAVDADVDVSDFSVTAL